MAAYEYPGLVVNPR